MLIDWFTVGAQALNFIILVWLLKHFLYKPILNAIDAREKRIAAELADADAKKAEALKERNEFQNKNDSLDKARAALMSKATDDAKAEGQRLLEVARKTADALRAKRQEALRNDADLLSHAVRQRAQQEVFAISRQALTDLATASLEERMCDVLVRHLHTMDVTVKAAFAKTLKTASEPALVRSAFDLPAPQQATIQKALDETFSLSVPIRFEIAPDLVSGIEFSARGQKLAWSIADYLTSLENSVGGLIKEKGESAPKAEAKASPKLKALPKTRATAKAKPAAGKRKAQNG
jgi:F-type H+-transporting ATPase subunit b